MEICLLRAWEITSQELHIALLAFKSKQRIQIWSYSFPSKSTLKISEMSHIIMNMNKGAMQIHVVRSAVRNVLKVIVNA